MIKTKQRKNYLSVFPDANPTKSRRRMPLKAFEFDMDVLKEMREVTGLESFPEDFLTLNGDVSEYGWQRVMQLAVYEKYNYFLPFLSEALGKSMFTKSLEADLFDDFMYVYCTMMTLILRPNPKLLDSSYEKELYVKKYSKHFKNLVKIYEKNLPY